jgi:hypothetical protein
LFVPTGELFATQFWDTTWPCYLCIVDRNGAESVSFWHMAEVGDNMPKVYTFNRKESCARLYIKQRGKCAECKNFDSRLTIDHIIPTSKGGADAPANWQLLCRECNSRKGAKQRCGTQHTIFDKPRWDVYKEPQTSVQRSAKARTLARAEGFCIICRDREDSTHLPAPGRSTCRPCGIRANEARVRRKALR